MQNDYFIVYQTTNLVNSKIYIGVHKTDDLEDGYLGSGTKLRRAVKKYGRASFAREILVHCASLEEAQQKERELVNEDFIARPDTYNIVLGGGSGFEYVNELIKDNNPFKGKKHSEESKARMSASIRARFSEPEMRQKLSDIQKETQNRPEERARNSERQREAQNRPEVKAAKAARARQFMADPITKQKHALAMSKPEVREQRRRRTSNTKWMVHPEVDGPRSIKLDQVEDHLAQGWRLGMLLKK